MNMLPKPIYIYIWSEGSRRTLPCAPYNVIITSSHLSHPLYSHLTLNTRHPFSTVCKSVFYHTRVSPRINRKSVTWLRLHAYSNFTRLYSPAFTKQIHSSIASLNPTSMSYCELNICRDRIVHKRSPLKRFALRTLLVTRPTSYQFIT